uniref:ANK_REP_REGION domain-containing protein n=1 Tax=Parastrongyloides trichosuri TaxID=131310 RepID=A0A0N4ZKL6_PARTI
MECSPKFFVLLFETKAVHGFETLKETTDFLKKLGKAPKVPFYPLETYKNFLTNDAIDWDKYKKYLDRMVGSNIVNDIPFDKVKIFPTPSMSELSKFNNSIKKMDIGSIKNFIDGNPKYLINTDNDMPQIIFSGSKTNALFQAARFANLDAIVYICKVLRNDNFWEQLYEKNDMFRLRIEMYWDNLMNGMDKNFDRTPLHYACACGYEDIVKFLLKFKEINPIKKNAKGKTAYDVICNQCLNKDEDTEMNIRNLFRSCYVSLYTSPYRNEKPKVVITKDDPLYRAKKSTDIQDFSLEEVLIGCAGPILEEHAENFKKNWLKPDNESLALGHLIYERRGFKLSKSFNVEYTQYFEFLKNYVNVRNKESLEKLNNYFENVYDLKNFKDCMEIDYNNDVDELTSLMERILKINSNGNKEGIVDSTSLYNLDDRVSDDDVDFSTPPSSPEQNSFMENYSNFQMNKASENVYSSNDILFLSSSVPATEDVYLYEILKEVSDTWKTDEFLYLKLFVASCEKLSVKRIKDFPPLNSPRHKKLCKNI